MSLGIYSQAVQAENRKTLIKSGKTIAESERYAYHALMATAPAEGFTIKEEETLADGTLRVFVGR